MGPAVARVQARDPGRDRSLADPDADLGLPARVSTVLDPTTRGLPGHLGRGTTDRGATGRRHPGNGATASPADRRVSGRSSGARKGRGRTDRQVDPGRTDRARSDHGRAGHPATTVHGRADLGTTVHGRAVRPVRVRPLTGDRVATPDAGPFVPSGRPRCRHPRSSDLTRS
jgi:hypothetical protein